MLTLLCKIPLLQQSLSRSSLHPRLPYQPGWARVAAFAHVLTLTSMREHDPGASALRPRPRMPHYDLIDFAVVLVGYILSGEPTRLSFYERLARLSPHPS